jgi:hypothetical protein
MMPTEHTWSKLSGPSDGASRRHRTCQVLAALLMAVVASPMAGFALQMHGPAVIAALFGSESESEEDASSDASEFSELFSRPGDRCRRNELYAIHSGDSSRRHRRAACEWQRIARRAAIPERFSRMTPLRC